MPNYAFISLQDDNKISVFTIDDETERIGPVLRRSWAATLASKQEAKALR